MPLHTRLWTAHTLIASTLLIGSGLHAQAYRTDATASTNAAPWHFKLTASNYDTRGLTAAQDINLRGTREDTTWWVAHYRRASEFEQSRAGWEQN